MSPQQLHERILADCSILAKAFLDDERYGAAVSLTRAAKLINYGELCQSVVEQVAEMSDDDYEPKFAEGRPA